MTMATRKLVSELVEAWNSHDLDLAARFYAMNYVGEDCGQSRSHHGKDGLKEFLGSYLSAFPDWHLQATETLVDGNRVALAWAASGTHKGTILNIPATGRTISIRGVSMLTIAAGEVERATYLWDVAGLLREVGLLPEL